MNFREYYSVAVLAASLLMPGVASALTVEQTVLFGGSSSGEAVFLEFDAFDTSLGTLTKASISAGLTVRLEAGTITGTENCEEGELCGFRGFRDVEAQLVGGGFSTVNFSFGDEFSCIIDDSVQDCTASYGANEEDIRLYDEIAFNPSPPGSSDVVIRLTVADALTVLDGERTGGPSTAWESLGGRAVLTYTYDPAPATVPLPAGLTLLLTGMVGFAGLRMRENRKTQV